MTKDEFIEQCLQCVEKEKPSEKITELLEGLLSQPEGLREIVGAPSEGKIERLYVSATLTILNVVWAPKMSLLPHNHNMWAVIGVYQGREDNIFWRRCKDDSSRIEAAGAKSLGAGDVSPLGKNIIHSVTNPLESFTGAIHVYGGDFFALERSEWSPDSLLEQAYDVERNVRSFAIENEISKVRKTLSENK